MREDKSSEKGDAGGYWEPSRLIQLQVEMMRAVVEQMLRLRCRTKDLKMSCAGLSCVQPRTSQSRLL